MSEKDLRDAIAQWAFDTRPLLLRFHLWARSPSQTGPRQGCVAETPRVQDSPGNGRHSRRWPASV